MPEKRSRRRKKPQWKKGKRGPHMQEDQERNNYEEKELMEKSSTWSINGQKEKKNANILTCPQTHITSSPEASFLLLCQSFVSHKWQPNSPPGSFSPHPRRNPTACWMPLHKDISALLLSLVTWSHRLSRSLISLDVKYLLIDWRVPWKETQIHLHLHSFLFAPCLHLSWYF